MNFEKARKIQKTYQVVRYLMIAAILVMLGVAKANAQETKEYPKGKPIVTIFGDAHASFQEGNSPQWGFNLDRAYLGYQYEYNENWKAKIVFDMGKGEDKKLQRIAYLKNAEIDYKKDNFSLNMGVTSTALFNIQEKFWGFRYVYKSFMDERGWESSADLGLLASYQFNNWLSADASVFNGEGYKKIQNDNQLQYGIGLTIKPVDGLTLRAYTDFKTAKDTSCQENVAFFAGYKTKVFRIGAEYNMQFNHSNADGCNLKGVSVYGAGRLSGKAELFARYDYEESNDGWVYDNNQRQTGILGLDYQINKIFSVSPNVRLNKIGADKAEIYTCVSGKVNL